MKEIELNSKVKFYPFEELTPEEQALVEKAKKATENSYAPYSHFHVGAAVRLNDGTEFIGCNQENASFPVTVCGERTAIFAAQAHRPDMPIKQLAIAAQTENGFTENPVSPCGVCRQAILETEERFGQPVKIYLYGASGVYVIDSIRQLLPLCFVDADMH
ncbi:MAG: cytidine deaminase [Prevotella sp.]|nr:cytidine deaminase [Prevotella sp.]